MRRMHDESDFIKSLFPSPCYECVISQKQSSMGKVHVGDKLHCISLLTGGGEEEWMDGRMRGVTKVSRQNGE